MKEYRTTEPKRKKETHTNKQATHWKWNYFQQIWVSRFGLRISNQCLTFGLIEIKSRRKFFSYIYVDVDAARCFCFLWLLVFFVLILLYFTLFIKKKHHPLAPFPLPTHIMFDLTSASYSIVKKSALNLFVFIVFLNHWKQLARLLQLLVGQIVCYTSLTFSNIRTHADKPNINFYGCIKSTA